MLNTNSKSLLNIPILDGFASDFCKSKNLSNNF